MNSNSNLNANQKQIYENYSKFQTFSDIVNNKLGRTEEYFKNVCGKDDLFIKTYIKTLGVSDETILSCAVIASKKCTLTGIDLSDSKLLLDQINIFRNNFFIELYNPYYKIFNDIKKGIQVIIDLYDNSQKTTNKLNIQKNNEFFDKLSLNVTLLKSYLDPNTELINYFDLNNLSTYIPYDILCESTCELSIKKNDPTDLIIINKKIVNLKTHILYTSTPELNCISIANDYSKKNTFVDSNSSNGLIFIVFCVICLIICCILSCMMYLQNRRNMGYETYNYTDTF
jgi:hypothetical protein